ncbi:hypothetical protein EDB89DRAFT_1927010 [Lactarius sanguifluus]|nr:hypothetical protein EDB89DRAFT_1927010 [Lactarius sanguifluus]
MFCFQNDRTCSCDACDNNLHRCTRSHCKVWYTIYFCYTNSPAISIKFGTGFKEAMSNALLYSPTTMTSHFLWLLSPVAGFAVGVAAGTVWGLAALAGALLAPEPLAGVIEGDGVRAASAGAVGVLLVSKRNEEVNSRLDLVGMFQLVGWSGWWVLRG